jgi:hypothetical protein
MTGSRLTRARIVSKAALPLPPIMAARRSLPGRRRLYVWPPWLDRCDFAIRGYPSGAKTSISRHPTHDALLVVSTLMKRSCCGVAAL